MRPRRPVTVRRALPIDAPLLAQHRATVWHEVGDWSLEALSPQILQWTAFFRERLLDETFVAFVAEEDERVIASAGVLIHVAIPRPGSRSASAGRVQSLYVVPEARRRGIARSLMDHIVRYARATALISLSLRPSDEARPLYAGFGFVEADEMLLPLISD